MKQRLSVRAIINEDGKALLLRRHNGRQTILGKYELPGGKLAYGEQPEDALRRYLYDDAGLHIQSTQLFDAVTYIDHDDRAIQYGVIVYLVTLSPQRHPMRLSGNYDKYKWHSMSSIQRSELTDLTQLLLGIIQQEELTDKTLAQTSKNDDKKASESSITIYSDGGSRGNPGPSAAGYVILNSRQEVIDEGGEYLGITTNNQAEYQGVRLGLERALELGYTSVEFKIDSMLVVNQMKGYYKIKNRELWPIHERIRLLMTKFEHVGFTHVNRQFNQLADGMVNKTLDAHERDKAA
ncbi:reverse transcriptase-like protein [Candidatus Saccharibacteria bacterium]|nr:reverse transcriptase-like protein [Candidatus Saccharibacteria bacterium]